MINTTTSKMINLMQLDKELGGYGLLSSKVEANLTLIQTEEGSPVTLVQLEAAIEAHTPPDYEAEKAALLTKLGISADEAKLLLS